MKYLIIAGLLLVNSHLFAQTWWMYLNKTAGGDIFLVDTLTHDTKEFKTFDGHHSVVVIWGEIYTKTINGTEKHIEQKKYKIAIDNKKKQYEVKSMVVYKDKTLIINQHPPIVHWLAIIPGSIADNLSTYAKSLTDNDLKIELRTAAAHNFNPNDPKTFKYRKKPRIRSL